MTVNIINESSRGLPAELLASISAFDTMDVINDIADEYVLRIGTVKIVYDDEKNVIAQEFVVTDK